MKIIPLVSRVFKHSREQLVTFGFATVFGVVLTGSLFHWTSPPTSSPEVRRRISDLVLTSTQPQVNKRIERITLDYFSSELLDLSASNSEFVFGTINTEDAETFRFLGIFQPSAPGLLDKVVGRPGFIEPTYVAVIPAFDDASVVLSNVEVKDVDLDGNKEIFVTMKSTRADSVATGLVVLKKDKTDTWNALGIPLLDGNLNASISDHGVDGRFPQDASSIWFAKTRTTEKEVELTRERYKGFSVSQEALEIIHSGETTEFSMLHNGGRIELFTHPETGYVQLGAVVSLADGEFVQADHHVMVTFLRIEEKQITVDEAWNWGRPMLSLDTESTREIDLHDFQSVGIDEHTVDGTFYTRTEFHRSTRAR